jgi:hypothetical protein
MTLELWQLILGAYLCVGFGAGTVITVQAADENMLDAPWQFFLLFLLVSLLWIVGAVRLAWDWFTGKL